jgi:hypothetical protein
VIELINKTIVAALKQPSTVDKLRDMGAEIVASAVYGLNVFCRCLHGSAGSVDEVVEQFRGFAKIGYVSQSRTVL